MTGQLVFCSKKTMVAGGHSNKEKADCEKTKHSYVIFNFDSGEKLFFNDQRTFGALKIVNILELTKIQNKFGIEPLQKNFTLTTLKNIIQNRKTNIKALLLNQQLISGIGNIYADEILFKSNVSPLRITNTLSEVEIKEIFTSSKTILRDAIKSRGTTFNNYVDGQGQKGSYIKKLKVYGRAGENCLNCSGKLQKVKVAGRGTVYCAKCQK
jgi:formamidopyrimidine-DNA glycosylase